MLHSYLLIAFRSLWNNRVYTGLNVAGLALGMAASLMLFQYLRYEWSYDHQSPHAAQIYRAFNETINAGKVVTQDANTHSALGPALKADLPEVVDYCRLYNRNLNEVVFDQLSGPVKLQGAWMCDPGFLRMFPQRFLAGDPKTCLLEPNSIVLSESAARQLFPRGDAIGKVLEVPGGTFTGQHEVKAIVADPPPNTHLKFKALFSYETRYADGFQNNWDSYWEYNYFQLKPGADLTKVQAQLARYSVPLLKDVGIRLNFQPLLDIHQKSKLTYEIESNADGRSLKLLFWVALFILGIGFVNYINLSTARAAERAKEVGLRKVIGARRWQLTLQFLLEGFLVNALALCLAFTLFGLFMPTFAKVVACPLLEYPGCDLKFWAIGFGMLISGISLAALYPSLHLTTFQPALSLKGTAKTGKGLLGLRQVLVVLQFVCSIALIVSLLTVKKQLQFLHNHHLGLSLEQVMSIKPPVFNWQEDSINRRRTAALKNRLAQIPGISHLASSEIVPGLGISSISGTSDGVYWERKPSAALRTPIYFVNADSAFYPTFGIRFVAGQFPGSGYDERQANEHLIINEAACKAIGFANPEEAIGQRLAYDVNSDYRMTIHGVVADFHIESLKEPARPTLYFCQNSVNGAYLSIKTKHPDLQGTLAKVQAAWQQVFPEQAFDYVFLDQNFDAQYRTEERLGKVFALFSALAIGIACLGLLGLAAYLALRKRKEIGVRKTLGARVIDIVGMLSFSFIRLVLVAAVVACPLAWYLLDKWLNNFAYRIDFPWLVLPLACFLALLAATLVVGSLSFRTALENPARSIRTE
jgi:putative ABC transport system permease protein